MGFLKKLKSIFGKKEEIKEENEEINHDIPEMELCNLVEHFICQETMKRGEPIMANYGVCDKNLVIIEVQTIETKLEYSVSYTGFMTEEDRKEFEEERRKSLEDEEEG